jgi:hypothetical protein
MRERIKVEATDMDKKEEMSVITVEEDAFIDIKLEETSVVKFEEEMLVVQKKISLAICVCPLLDTFYEYPIVCTIVSCVNLCLSVCEQIKQLHCSEWKHFYHDSNPRTSSIHPSHCNDYAIL